MTRRSPRLTVVEPNYTLRIARGIYGAPHFSGMLEITEPLPGDLPVRLSVLETLIALRKAETVSSPLPDTFPVLPAALDAVTAPYEDNPSLLRVRFREAVQGETTVQRLQMAQDIAPVVVDFVVGRFDPLSQ